MLIQCDASMSEEERLRELAEMLVLVRDNLFSGMSKSMQKLQAESINEVLGLPKYVKSHNFTKVGEC